MRFFKRRRSKSDRRKVRKKPSSPRLRVEGLEERTLLSGNPIVQENAKPGTDPSIWDITGSGDPTIQGYATDISVNHGQTVSFKINDTAAVPYHIDIYRMGYYQGNGACLEATIPATQTLDQVQPNPLTDSTTHLIDAGNWAVSASWSVPSTAVSGIYFARVTRNDTGGASHILFIVRADDSHSDLLFKTSDATWEAYNTWGGNSLYGPPDRNINNRAYAVSYNRPYDDRGQGSQYGAITQPFYEEYPMVRWLEANGYDVSYFTDIDTARSGSLILNHKTFLSVGHDEYWSGDERTSVETARNAGVNLAFFSANELYWKTRLANSIDGSNTPNRTIVCYKESLANAKIDPLPYVWTGLWRDPRFSPPADGGRPENALSGTTFTVNFDGTYGVPITVSSDFANLRFWRNTAVASLQAGQSISLGDLVLGFEWDEDLNNGARPPGLFDLSSTTRNVGGKEIGYGGQTGPGTATHSLTLYRASSGALVFGAGTVQWSWGLDGNHDGLPSTPDINLEQATVNLLADMGAQPGTIQPGLITASQSTDRSPPTSVITSPAPGASVNSGTPVLITGTATDPDGGAVAVVEVSTDGGVTWNRATGRNSWSYMWTPGALGQVNILSRAADDSANMEKPSTGNAVNVFLPTGPLSLFGSSVPQITASTDTSSVELGVKFTADISGTITGVRFYKGTGNGGTHLGHLWTVAGTLLATAQFSNETASGWQTVNFASPVGITAGTTYVASYFAPQGHYAVDDGYFGFTGLDNGPLHAPSASAAGGQGVYQVGIAGGFPGSSNIDSANYWVDVVFVAPRSSTPPTVASQYPTAANLPVNVPARAVFSEQVVPSSVSFTLKDSNNRPVPAALTYYQASQTAILVPSSPLAGNTQYQASVSGLIDLSGNVMAGSFNWFFTTGPTNTPPAWLTTDPADGSTNMAVASAISVTFNESVKPSSISFVLKDASNNTVAGTVSYDPVYLKATFTPSTPLAALSSYTATVSGATDATLNVMAAHTWQFTTAPAKYSLFSSTTTPALLSANDTSAVELGVKFKTDVAGTISSLRFYKGPANGGTHVAHLWASDGTLLATATFTGETGFGWQQVNFATPVAIDPNTTYIASYYAPSGGYAYNGGYFATSGVDVGPLHALSNAAGGGNGVYAYANGGAVPASTGNSANYWVDVVFNAIPDTTPPTVISESPAPNATNVSNNALLVTATFSKAIQPATISFILTDPSNNSVPATLSYVRRVATLAPTSPLAGFTTYKATLSGATDLSGNVIAPLSWTFSTGTPSYTLWTASATPAVASANDGSALELGVKIRTDLAGPIAGVRFYKGSTNTGTHVAHLWTAGGTLLASATFTNESATGWQEADFSAPVVIAPNITYIVSYYAPSGGYAYTGGYFLNSGVDVGPLHALSNTAGGGNGVYKYGIGGGFPTSSSNSANYWVDAVFAATSAHTWQQTTSADFSLGDTSGNTTVTNHGDGAVQMAQVPTLLDDFPGSALNAQLWTTASWTSQGGGQTNISVANSILSVQGGYVLSAQSYASAGVEGLVSFGAAAGQHFGLATGFASVVGNYWAIFSTAGTTNTLFARVNANGTTQDVSLGALPTGFHTYKILPLSTGFAFYVDGVLQTTINIAFPSGTAPRIALSDFRALAGAPLQIDRASLDTYPASATYLSTTFDAGHTAQWGLAAWNVVLPAGTGIVVETSSSNDKLSWSVWAAVSNGGTVASPAARYLRYRVTFTTTDQSQTAILDDIAFNWS